jgi:hypothetical protein
VPNLYFYKYVVLETENDKTDPARVADPHHFNADPNPAFHFNADPDPAFRFDGRIRILLLIAVMGIFVHWFENPPLQDSILSL